VPSSRAYALCKHTEYKLLCVDISSLRDIIYITPNLRIYSLGGHPHLLHLFEENPLCYALKSAYIITVAL
jgi:hypothetical protein